MKRSIKYLRNLIVSHKASYTIPRFGALVVFFFVSIYTLITFFGDREVFGSVNGFIFYFSPSITLLICTLIAWKYRWGGFLFILASYALLLPYKLPIGVLISSSLLITGILFLISNHKIKKERKKERKIKKLVYHTSL